MPSVTEVPIEVQGPRLAYLPEWVMDEASDTAIHLYARLTRYVNATGECWPSRATLAEKLRCSVKTIDRAVKDLERVGAVQVIRRTNPENTKRNLSSVYVLLVDKAGKRIGSDSLDARGRDTAVPTLGTAVSPKEKPVKKEPSVPRRKPETPIPDPFVPTTPMLQWVRDNGLEVDVAKETAQFRDHALAHDRRARDWVAAWRTWMRRAEEYRLQRANNPTTEPTGRREWEA